MPAIDDKQTKKPRSADFRRQDHTVLLSGLESDGINDPIDLIGIDDSNASETETDDGSCRIKSAEPDADLFHSQETAVNLTTRAPSSPYK